MSRRSAARPIDDRETSGAIDFDAALEAYLDGGDAEDLLCAAAMVLGSTIPLDPERAEAIAELTGTRCELLDDRIGLTRGSLLALGSCSGATSLALLIDLRFGMHRGERFDAAPEEYLRWIAEGNHDLSEDVRFSARCWLDRRAAA